MKVDGLARKAPRRWAQVSRLKGAMVRHAGPCREERSGDEGGPRRAVPRGRQTAPEPLHQP